MSIPPHIAKAQSVSHLSSGLSTAVGLPTSTDDTARFRPQLEELKEKIAQVEDTLPRTGCWMAFFEDFSDAFIFDSELEALRHAVNNKMSCRFVEWGQSIKLPFDPRFDT